MPMVSDIEKTTPFFICHILLSIAFYGIGAICSFLSDSKKNIMKNVIGVHQKLPLFRRNGFSDFLDVSLKKILFSALASIYLILVFFILIKNILTFSTISFEKIIFILPLLSGFSIYLFFNSKTFYKYKVIKSNFFSNLKYKNKAAGLKFFEKKLKPIFLKYLKKHSVKNCNTYLAVKDSLIKYTKKEFFGGNLFFFIFLKEPKIKNQNFAKQVLSHSGL